MACHANQHALIPVSERLLQTSADEVQKIRGILRFVLGALSDYTFSDIPYNSLTLIDKYILHLLWTFDSQVILLIGLKYCNTNIILGERADD